MNRMRIVSLVFAAFAIVLFVWYFINNIDDFVVLLHVPWWALVGIAAGFIVSLIANGLFIRLILHAHNRNISTHDSINASVISAVGNFFFPVGVGSAAQARYLKQSHKFSYTNFISSLSGNYILVFVVNGILGILALLFMSGYANLSEYWVLLAVFIAMLLPNLYFAIKGLPTPWKEKNNTAKTVLGRIANIVMGVLDGWNFIVKSKGLVSKLTILIFCNFIASMTIGYFSIIAAGATVGFWSLVLYSALGAVTLVLNITPGSIGVREGVFLLAMSIIGLNASQVLAVSLVERGIRFFVLLVGLALFSKYFKISKKKESYK